MMQQNAKEALKSLLYSRRKLLKPSQRRRPARSTRWLYPWSTEKHYGALIRAYMRPVKEFVHEYLKAHQEMILHGDSAAIIRNDATTGLTFNRMIDSLNGWLVENVPEPGSKKMITIHLGLGNIAESAFDFNDKQYEKSMKAELGVEFPVYENWWPDAKSAWVNRNYAQIQSNIKSYIGQIEASTEQAVTNGWSIGQLSKKIMSYDDQLSHSKANFIARDQIGKLNGDISHRRMEAAGFSMYIWDTSNDERVRPSHQPLEGQLCRWDDGSVYSDDGGKHWKDRPADWFHGHPGEDYQCRCTPMVYFDELIGEVDEQIDLLAQNEYNLGNNVEEGARVMPLPKAKTSNELLKEQQAAKEKTQFKQNKTKTLEMAEKLYPEETWIKTAELQNANRWTKKLVIPKNVILATSRIPVGKTQAEILEKELNQAKILIENGNFVALTPEHPPYGKRIIDAIVNGTQFEFRNIVGKSRQIEQDFSDAKTKGKDVNVFLNIVPDISKQETRRLIKQVLKRHPDYTGKIVVSFQDKTGYKIYYWETESFR
ncbi:MAG: hypothetical protein Ta2B_14280 [Termitinemataceae bacterium]|nr:MAG: hypothetical protein Ta2B_14280 [Termitinemataceae bacterium]